MQATPALFPSDAGPRPAFTQSAIELHDMLGNMERNIPGWIQDHITNAENYIDQAAQGFHELDNNEQ